jgi:hypothetical protein
VKEIQEICVERQIIKDKVEASSNMIKAGASFSKIKAGASSSKIRASSKAEAWEMKGGEEGKKEENREGTTELPSHGFWFRGLVRRENRENGYLIGLSFFFTSMVLMVRIW